MDKKDGEEQFGGEKQGGKEGWRKVVRRENHPGKEGERAGWKGGESKVERKDIEQGAKEGWRGVVRREEQSGRKE